MTNSRGYVFVLSLYIGVLVLTLGVITMGLTAVMQNAPRPSQQVQRKPTLLDLRVQRSREIREALAKPVPPPEPLPPRTARPAHALGSRVMVSQHRPHKLLREDRDASASEGSSSSRGFQSSYAEFDRHSYQ